MRLGTFLDVVQGIANWVIGASQSHVRIVMAE